MQEKTSQGQIFHSHFENLTYPSSVFKDFGVRFPIVRWIGVWVISELGKHGRDHGHVLEDVRWYLPHPFGQSSHVDRLDDLVCRSLYSENNISKYLAFLKWC